MIRTRCRGKGAVSIAVLVSSATLFWCSVAWAIHLYGTVFFADGKPAAKVSIQVQDGPQVITDSSGGYVLDLPPGNYVLKVHRQEFSVQVSADGGISRDLRLK